MRAFLIASLLVFSFTALAEDIVFQLNKSENLRILVSNVLEVVELIPAGATISVSASTSPETHNYRTQTGAIERSSNGFFPSVKIISGNIPSARMTELNSMNLWISVTVVPIRAGAIFPAIKLPEAQAPYLQSFESNGKPKFNFSSYYKTRFPKSLNRTVPAAELSPQERKKWAAIMRELTLAGDRTVETKTSYLFMSVKEAQDASLDYENNDEVPSYGAWTVAVKATAPRHGFANVPCAEFMSELIRQAYKRAGHDVFEDFNRADDTYLIWSKTSAVINLTNTLNNVGWIPWELAYYRPPTGAIMAHFKATTPGHVYMAAGLDGRIIVDNGSPAGRTLYETSEKTIKMMYLGGVFFLPPGLVPLKW